MNFFYSGVSPIKAHWTGLQSIGLAALLKMPPKGNVHALKTIYIRLFAPPGGLKTISMLFEMGPTAWAVPFMGCIDCIEPNESSSLPSASCSAVSCAVHRRFQKFARTTMMYVPRFTELFPAVARVNLIFGPCPKRYFNCKFDEINYKSNGWTDPRLNLPHAPQIFEHSFM